MKKKLYEFMFFRRNPVTYFVRDLKNVLGTIHVKCPQLFPLIEMKFRSGVRRYEVTQQCVNIVRLILEDYKTAKLVLQKILSFFSNVELFAIADTQWKKFIQL